MSKTNCSPKKYRRAINKTNIKYPRFHCDKLYKFGFDKQASQKYQFQKYKRRFIAVDGIIRPKINHHWFPKYGKGPYLNHSCKHSNRYKIIVKNVTIF